MKRSLRFGPTENFLSGLPHSSLRPSGRKAVRARTFSRVLPYFAARSPPALQEMLPPIDEYLCDDGSGAYIRPNCAARASTSAVTAPAPTRAILSDGKISIKFIPERSRTTPPRTGTQPPEHPVPEPRGQIGTPNSEAILSAAETSSPSRARTRAAGIKLCREWSSDAKNKSSPESEMSSPAFLMAAMARNVSAAGMAI